MYVLLLDLRTHAFFFLLFRVEYDGNHGVGVVSQQLYTSLTGIQMGLLEDRMGWTVQLN
jgi:hypothetical protein